VARASSPNSPTDSCKIGSNGAAVGRGLPPPPRNTVPIASGPFRPRTFSRSSPECPDRRHEKSTFHLLPIFGCAFGRFSAFSPVFLTGLNSLQLAVYQRFMLEAEVGIEPTLLSNPLIYNKLGFSASLMASLPWVTLPLLLPAIWMQVPNLDRLMKTAPTHGRPDEVEFLEAPITIRRSDLGRSWHPLGFGCHRAQ